MPRRRLSILSPELTAGPAAFSYDTNGNLTSDGSVTYSYDTENRLTAASGAKTASLLYDPLGRLVRVRDANVANARWFIYDGSALVAEYDGAGNMVKRYMHGPGVDEPLAWFDGSGTAAANRHDMFANAQGSIIAITNGSGVTETINRYDEFGIPQPGNAGRFGFTGQAWIPELGLSYYKARMYSPSLGRFMQTDPIGYDDGPNWYNYVGGDPVNRVDPTGLSNDGGLAPNINPGAEGAMITVICCSSVSIGVPGGFSGFAGLTGSGGIGGLNSFGPINISISPDLNELEQQSDIVVTASRPSQSRRLNAAELHFYSQIYDSKLLAGITLYNGLPPGFSSKTVGAVTLSKKSIYLNSQYYGPNMLANSYTAGLLGHELFHATAQYANGVTLMDFIASYSACNCYANSRYEAPAFIMESNIVQLYNAGVR